MGTTAVPALEATAESAQMSAMPGKMEIARKATVDLTILMIAVAEVTAGKERRPRPSRYTRKRP